MKTTVTTPTFLNSYILRVRRPIPKCHTKKKGDSHLRVISASSPVASYYWFLSPCRSDFASPGLIESDFSSLILKFGLLLGLKNLSAARPQALDKNFKPSKCQMAPRGEISFTYPAPSAMQFPSFTRAREIGASSA
jgi:hypothetical protein